ncbi:MAG: hypothetical protein HYY52_05550 [Candidatus Melainabacteria bacterium]|nr:hypothetical protein [Candidatus Melainabacteria bacterium]
MNKSTNFIICFCIAFTTSTYSMCVYAEDGNSSDTTSTTPIISVDPADPFDIDDTDQTNTEQN